jgi:phage FluMu protein Com
LGGGKHFCCVYFLFCGHHQLCLFYVGLVEFKCPTVKTLNAVMMLDEGQLRRIRGIAYVVVAFILISITFLKIDLFLSIDLRRV